MVSDYTADLGAFRREIDALDNRILAALGRRLEICKAVASHKKECGIPMMQPNRVEEVKQRYVQLGHDYGLEDDFSIRIIDVILEESFRLENQIIGERRDPTVASQG